MDRHLARIDVSPELVAKALHFPVKTTA